jgi:DNA modification methylase
MQTQSININRLKNNNGQIEGLPKNPRLLKDDKFKKLVKSIQDDPEMLELREVIAYDNNGELIVIAGNMRLKACQEIGIKEIPTKILPKETSVEKLKAYTIKDNVAFGEHDWNELANSWDVEQLTEWGLDIPNFDVNNLEAEEDDFAVPDGGTETDIVLGDLFEIGEHRLLCGDSTDSDQVAKLMNGQKADISFTSPPYNAGTNVRGKFYENDNDDKTNDDYVKFLYDFTINTLNNSTYSFVNLQILESNKHALIDYQYQLKEQLKDILIWNKKQYPPHINKGTFGCKWEYVFAFCYESKSRSFPASWQGKFPNVIETENASGNDFAQIHKATFPIAFPAWILDKMDFAQSVIDLFCGTGTTMVASHQLKRKCYGMELDPKYCQVIVDRMKKLDPSLIIKKNGLPL